MMMRKKARELEKEDIEFIEGEFINIPRVLCVIAFST